MSVEDVKLQASLNMGITATKEALVNGIMRIVNELSLRMTALVDEQKAEENTTAAVSQLLQTFQNHEQTIQNLERMSAGQADRIQYCQEFAYHLRWLGFAAGECANLTKARTDLLFTLTFRISQFVQPIGFVNEDGSARRVELVTQEVQNTVRELLFTKDVNPRRERTSRTGNTWPFGSSRWNALLATFWISITGRTKTCQAHSL